MPQNLSAKHVEALRVLAGRDGWMTAEEVCAGGGGVTPAGTGVMFRKLEQWGLVDRLRTKNGHEGPTQWRLTVHGQRVLEMELAHAAR